MKIVENYLVYLDIQRDNINEIGIAGVIGITSLVSMALKSYKSAKDKAGKYCQNFHGPEKTKCILDYKMKGLHRLISSLKAAQSRCVDDTCKRQVAGRIKSKKIEFDKYKAQLNVVQNQLYGKYDIEK
jgi:hypothetical protein